MRSPILTTVLLYILLETLSIVTCQGAQNHNHHQKHRRNDVRSARRLSDDTGSRTLDENSSHSNHIRRNLNPHLKSKAPLQESWSSEDDSSEEGSEHGRHAYVMKTDHLTSTVPPPPDEDRTLQDAFQKHMNPSPGFKAPHDIYAYKLPSELWFIIRYKRNEEGTMDKYMNVVSSFTNYLDKLDTSTKSVSVNVKGVETVFRLTSKS